MILGRQGSTVANNDRKKVRRKLYEIVKKENLSDKDKGKIYDDLFELVNTLNKKEEYKYHDGHDLDYYGIRDIENLFGDVDDNVNDYYKPYQLKVLFKTTINIMKAEQIKTKKYQ